MTANLYSSFWKRKKKEKKRQKPKSQRIIIHSSVNKYLSIKHSANT